MTLSEEIRAYLDFLIQHEQTCQASDCRTCQVARDLYEAVQNRLFEDGVRDAAPHLEVATRHAR